MPRVNMEGACLKGCNMDSSHGKCTNLEGIVLFRDIDVSLSVIDTLSLLYIMSTFLKGQT